MTGSEPSCDGERLAYLETEYAIERRQREDAETEVQELEVVIARVRKLADDLAAGVPRLVFADEVYFALDAGRAACEHPSWTTFGVPVRQCRQCGYLAPGFDGCPGVRQRE